MMTWWIQNIQGWVMHWHVPTNLDQHLLALRNLLFNVYHARKCHSTIAMCTDSALQNINPLILFENHMVQLCSYVYEEFVDDNTDLQLGEECIKGIGKAFISGGGSCQKLGGLKIESLKCYSLLYYKQCAKHTHLLGGLRACPPQEIFENQML